MFKLLIVDDDVSVRKLVIASLRKQDVVVLQALTGAEAIELSKQELPDIVVMDVVLPGSSMNGISAAQSIKSDPATAACKLLLISGAVHVSEDLLAQTGAEGFLSKPFNPIKLRDKVSRLLGGLPQG